MHESKHLSLKSSTTSKFLCSLFIAKIHNFKKKYCFWFTNFLLENYICLKLHSILNKKQVICKWNSCNAWQDYTKKKQKQRSFLNGRSFNSFQSLFAQRTSGSLFFQCNSSWKDLMNTWLWNLKWFKDTTLNIFHHNIKEAYYF